LLYFDLDTVIIKKLDWIPRLSLEYCWTVKDFKFLWKPLSHEANTSVMWFDTNKFNYVYKNFKGLDLHQTMLKYRGDQDFVTDQVKTTCLRFFDQNRVKSWRWQCLDGGYDFQYRKHRAPGQGTLIDGNTSVLVFHGNPKPHKINDKVVQDLWK
jgi:hypothetical protein